MSDTVAGLLQIGLLLILLAVCYAPLGSYLAWTFTSERHHRVERGAYRLLGVNGDAEQNWAVYARSVLAFSAVSVLVLFGLQRLQAALPLSNGQAGVDRRSRSTRRRRSSRTPTGRTTSRGRDGPPGPDGRACGAELRLGRGRDSGGRGLDAGLRPAADDVVGNFWVDLVRTCWRVLLPIAVIGAVALVRWAFRRTCPRATR